MAVSSCEDVVATASTRDDVRHDLPHLHGLTGRHLLDADDNLVIRRARGSLKQFPEVGEQVALVLCGSAVRISSVKATVAAGSPALKPLPTA
jgi:hypothetical protein